MAGVGTALADAMAVVGVAVAGALDAVKLAGS